MGRLPESADLAQRMRYAKNLDGLRAEVLAACGERVPYDGAVFIEYRPGHALTTVGMDREALELIRYCESSWDRYRDDLRKCFAAASRYGGFLDRDVYSSRERRELPLFCEVVRPQRVRSTLVLAPRWNGVTLGMIRLERRGALCFSDADFARIFLLLPVIELGLVAHRSLLDGGCDARWPQLSERENEVARHVGRGLTTRQIALLLGTSPLTVRNQISRIFDKLRVASRAELAASLAARAAATDGASVPSTPVVLPS